MSTDSDSKVVDLSELLPAFESIELPSGRSIEIAPYLTDKAMSAVGSEKSADEVFDLIVEGVIKSDEQTTADIDPTDRAAIALRLVASVDVTENYEAELSNGATVAFSFVQAVKASDAFRTRERQMRQMMASFERERKAAAQLAKRFAPIDYARELGYSPYIDDFASASVKMAKQFAEEAQRRESQIKALHGLTTSWFERYDNKLLAAQRQFESAMPQIGLIEPMRNQMQSLQLLGDQTLHLQQSLARHLGSIPKSVPPEIRFLSGLNELVANSNARIQAINEHFSSLEYLGARSRVPTEVAFDRRLVEEWTDLRSASELVIVQEHAELADITNDAVDGLQLDLEELTELDALKLRLNQMLTPVGFRDLLLTFATTVQREHWPLFWNKDGGFNPSPETIARSQLGLFLAGHAVGIAFTAQELTAGAGFVDILVYFFGKYYILELKVVGEGWSIGEAEGGLRQLDSYADKYPDASTFLVLFDGRKTTRGRQLDEEYQRATGRIIQTISTRIYQEPPTGNRK